MDPYWPTSIIESNKGFFRGSIEQWKKGSQRSFIGYIGDEILHNLIWGDYFVNHECKDPY